MIKIIQKANSPVEAFPKITVELKRTIDFDHISLNLATGPGQSMERISIGSSGGILVDRRAGIPTAGKVIGKVMRSGEVRIDRNIDLKESSSEDTLFKACGIKTGI